MEQDVYDRLARRMADLAVGPPFNEHLVEMLRESFTVAEAEILNTLPTAVPALNPVPLVQIGRGLGYGREELESILDGLAARGLVFRSTVGGQRGYALHQFGYGMPQGVFWPNEDTPYARRMADLCIQHSRPHVLTSAFGGPSSKVFRWVPVNKTLNSFKHAILPYAEIDEIVNRATVIAVVNCNCRVMSRIKGREPCQHPLDVCIKYDELAEYVIDVGIGRRVSKDEAKAVNKRAEEAGCVHFSDNVVDGGVKHTCNCCPCCCWSLGTFKRRRVPRDLLMACQFIRETDLDNCIGCEACAEACPIEAVVMQDDLPHVDMDWCIGCGVCASSCPNGAISMVRRAEVPDPFPDLRALHGKRLEEKVPAKEPET